MGTLPIPPVKPSFKIFAVLSALLVFSAINDNPENPVEGLLFAAAVLAVLWGYWWAKNKP